MIEGHNVLECARDRIAVLINLFVPQAESIRIFRRYPKENATVMPDGQGRASRCLARPLTGYRSNMVLVSLIRLMRSMHCYFVATRAVADSNRCRQNPGFGRGSSTRRERIRSARFAISAAEEHRRQLGCRPVVGIFAGDNHLGHKRRHGSLLRMTGGNPNL